MNFIEKQIENGNGVLVLSQGLENIEDKTFYGVKGLKKVVIPSSVKKIGEYAFFCCEDLEEVELQEGLKEIAALAFAECTSLSKIIIPSSVEIIGESAFSRCEKLEEIILGKGLKQIEKGTFFCCEYLKKIVIPNGVKKICAHAFSYCKFLQEVGLNEGLEIIDKSTFSDCTELQSINFPNSLKEIGINAFKNCTSLQEVRLKEGVEIIDSSCFSECTSLKKINIPQSVKKIGNRTFYCCKSLEEIELQEGLKEISLSAFSDCESLKKVVIPSSVNKLGKALFKNCFSLKEIILKQGITGIPMEAFIDCKSLEKINIPSSVKKIEEWAFENCSSLKEAFIEEGVEEIMEYAFEGCSSLEKITIPSSVKKIGNMAFSMCHSLKEIKLQEGLEEMGQRIFCECTSLEEIIIPPSVKKFDPEVFNGCESLKKIMMPLEMIINIKENIDIRNIEELLSAVNNRKLNDSYSSNKYIDICKIFKIFPNINLNLFCQDEMKLIDLEKRAKYFEKNGIVVPANSIETYDDFIKVTNKSYKKLKNLLNQITEEKDDVALCDLCKLAGNIGLLENDKITINGNKVPVSDIAFEVLQKAFKNGYLEFNDMHRRFSSMKLGEYNEEFLKFMSNKNNLLQLKEQEKKQNGFTTKVYEWFEERKHFHINKQNNNETEPRDEKNRYRIATYETADNGMDKLKWKNPTVELFEKNFVDRKFNGVTNDTKDLANYLEKFSLYEQKHFEKALEIDKERKRRNVKDHLTEEIVKEELIDSIENYRKRTQGLKEEIINESIESVKNQKDIAEKIFTYEMLAKSDKANFVMGFLTDCCATLYGSGSGAQRAMIIHEDMQPLVIRDIDGNIISFGIIYVNRKEGYAVVNDFEVNKKYETNERARREIYIKAMQGVDAFVKQYNKENSKKTIDIVTCGISPNWVAINDYIRQNPISEILKAPNFDDYKYVGGGFWKGDWHREQFIVLENKSKKMKNI